MLAVPIMFLSFGFQSKLVIGPQYSLFFLICKYPIFLLSSPSIRHSFKLSLEVANKLEPSGLHIIFVGEY